MLPPRWPDWLRLVGILFILAGVAGFVWAARTLGSSFTAYPRPRPEGVLVEDGPYRLVRHPVYGAGLLVPARLRVAARASWRRRRCRRSPSCGRLKSGVEERHLAERFPAYADYRRAGAAPDALATAAIVWRRERTWPEPVERVAAFLRQAGAEARLEELEAATDGRGRRARRGLPARPDRQVDRLPLRRPAGGRARSRRPSCRPGKIARAAGATKARIATCRGGRGGDGLRARRRRAVSAAEGGARPDRPGPARPRDGLGRRGLATAPGGPEPRRPRPARPRAARSTPSRTTHATIRAREEEAAMQRDRDDLDERRVRRLGRREGPRRRARAPLRHRRLRGHPLLRDPRRARRSSG